MSTRTHKEGWECTHHHKSKKKKHNNTHASILSWLRNKESNQQKLNKLLSSATQSTQHSRRCKTTKEKVTRCSQAPQPKVLDRLDFGATLGDRLEYLKEGRIRICSQNINGIPADGTKDKSLQCIQWLKEREPESVTLWQEIKLFWPNVTLDSKWSLRDKKPNYHAVFAYNKKEKCLGTKQQGGTAAIASRKTVSRIIDKGTEDLGRWCWLRIGRKGRKTARIISAYRPCENFDSGSCYQQQRRAWDDLREPREQFFIDLTAFVTSCHNEGDTVILAGDFNEEVYSQRFRQFMEESGLWNPLEKAHGTIRMSTQQRNFKDKTIDGLVCSIGLVPMRSGYAPPSQGLDSDHSLVWADFYLEDLVGEPLCQDPPEVDRLNLEDFRAIRKYNAESMRKISANKLDVKLEELSTIPTDSFSPDQVTKFNTVVQEITKIRKSVKRKAKHIFCGHQPWSPTRSKAFKRRKLYVQVVKFKRRDPGSCLKRSFVRRLMKVTGERDALYVPLGEAELCLKVANAECKKAVREAEDNRLSFLKDQDRAWSIQTGTPIKSIARARICREEQQRQGRVAKKVRKQKREEVSRVYITRQGNRVECDDKRSVEDACREEGIRHFNQTRDLPPMQPDVIEHFGYAAEKEGANRVLFGTFDVNVISNKYLRKLLKYLCLPRKLIESGLLSDVLTLDEHIKGWRKQKKKTASVSSQLTFSDNIAATYHEGLAKVDLLIRQIPYRVGFPPEYGSTIEDFQILKKSGLYDVELMRIIQMMAAAFNMNNKCLGREGMANAEKFGLIPNEQAGSRKRRRAGLSALEKVLVNDILRSRRYASILISNDTRSCYDRIVLWVAALAMRRCGLPTNAVTSMIRALLQAKHIIKTAYSLAAGAYGHEEYPPFQGCGQGNGAGPMIWVVISAVLLTIMKDMGWGLSIVSCMSMLLVSIIGFAFVDDTDLVHSANGPSVSAEQIVGEAQAMLTMWDGILAATGVDLRPDKSYWYMVDFEYKNGGWKYKKSNNMLGELYLKEYKIRRCEPEEANETLGVLIAADGNWDKQVEELRSKAQEFGGQVLRGDILHKDAWYTFTRAFLPSLEYCFPATSIGAEEWESIINPALGPALRKSGTASTASRKMVFSSIRFQGRGVYHPEYNQFFTQLGITLTETRAVSSTGELMITMAEEVKREAGCFGPIGDIPSEVLETLVTRSWMRSLLQFLARNEVKLMDDCPSYEPSREGDKSLVEEALRLGYRGFELKDIKNCCDYAGVVTIADIASFNGKRVRKCFSSPLSVIKRVQPGRSSPRMVPLRCLNWRLFRELLSRVSDENGRLNNPLGRWYKSFKWLWWYSPSKDKLYKQESSLLLEFVRSERRFTRRGGKSFQRASPSILDILVRADPPDDLIPAEVSEGAEITLEDIDNHPFVPPSAPPCNSLCESLQQNHASTHWSVQRLVCSDEGIEFADAIVDGQAILITDGSYQSCVCTGGIVATSRSNPSNRITASNEVAGTPKQSTPYRAELGALYGGLNLAEAICRLHGVSSGSIDLGLDGESAMMKAAGDNLLGNSSPSADLIHAIRFCVKQLRRLYGVEINLFWVEGHQLQKYGKQSFEGSLNHQADQLAKLHYKTRPPTREPTQAYEGEGWSVFIGGVKQESYDKDVFYNLTFGRTVTRDYWKNRQDLSDESFDDIDWDILERATRDWYKSHANWISKSMAGISPTGRVMLRREKWTHDRCPRCDQENKDSWHILTCQDPTAKKCWRDLVSQLRVDLSHIDTDPYIVDAVCSHLLGFYAGKRIFVDVSRPVRDAISAQNAIGWNLMLVGRVSLKWRQAQDLWLRRIHTKWRSTGATWGAKFCKLLMNLHFSMWEHQNESLHSADQRWKREAREGRIVQLNNLRDQLQSKVLHRSDRWLLRPVDFESAEDDTQVHWLASARQAIRRATDRSSQRSITDWVSLPPTQPVDPPAQPSLGLLAHGAPASQQQ